MPKTLIVRYSESGPLIDSVVDRTTWQLLTMATTNVSRDDLWGEETSFCSV